MPIHLLTLLKREEVARDTLEFQFQKPDGFNFKPGQYGGFTLTHRKDLAPTSTTRRFSLLNPPHDDCIRITTRMQNSDYKRALNELAIGESIKFAGPIGNFTLPDDINRPVVFIAGGIGVTPFYCMIKHAIHVGLTRSITLFYGNQTVEDAAYFAELKELSLNNPQFRFVPVLANGADVAGTESGYISYEMIKKYIPDLLTPMFYVCGSPGMVNALRETLSELDIPAEHIMVEDFPGY